MRPKRNMPATAMFISLASMTLVLPAAAQDAAKPKRLWPKLRIGDDQSYVEIYGQIDKGVLVFDDGGETLGYVPVDNNDASTRGGVRLYGDMGNGWSIGANGEVEWTPYSTNNVDQLNHGDFDWDSHLLRKAEIYFNSKAYGKVWLGQGSMASESTAEADLSGTSVVGYSQVSDMAGGPFFRKDDGALSSVHVKDAFSNFDGVGRKLRARYDTPSFQGFSIAASVGTQIVPTTTDVTVWDVAARYDNTLGDYSVSGAVAFSKPADDQSLYDGSISILHDPTGLSITLAAAYSDEQTVNSRYGYVKLGYQTDIFDLGTTAFSIDGYFGKDVAAGGSDSTAFGAQLVQNLDYLRTELYLGARSYNYEEAAADFDDSLAVLAGARVKF